MAWRERVLIILDTALRVPPLFVMDAVLNKYFINLFLYSDGDELDSLIHRVAAVIFSVIVFLLALLTFVLTTPFLLNIYCTGFIISLVVISYQWNVDFVLTEVADSISTDRDLIAWNMDAFTLRTLFHVGENVVTQSGIAYVFILLTDVVVPRRAIVASFLLPCVARLLLLPQALLTGSPMMAAAVPALQLLLLFANNAGRLSAKVLLTVRWMRGVVRNYNLQALVESQWGRLHVPNVLRAFFLTRVIEQATYLIAQHWHSNAAAAHTSAATDDAGVEAVGVSAVARWQVVGVGMMREVVVRGCETVVALLGMTGWLSTISHHLVSLVHTFLDAEDEDDRSIGTVSAILFFILAVQTGLTGLEPEKRLTRLYRNVCLLATAILHFIHTMVNPILLALGASRNRSISKHCRALTVCALLIIVPVWFIYYLWLENTLSTWLFAVSAFCIEVIIKVVISLMLYFLFLIDAYRNTFWEELDDYVHYIKSIGSSIEFTFGIVLFCNGLYIMLFESGGTVRAIMMCIHAYFNIWLQAKEGWAIFVKRRTAVAKINTLPLATPEQLAQHNDVCAICYQELRDTGTARITHCTHYFHALCLRKWLYVQDNCPLCHKVLYDKGELGEQPAELDVPVPPQLHQHDD